MASSDGHCAASLRETNQTVANLLMSDSRYAPNVAENLGNMCRSKWVHFVGKVKGLFDHQVDCALSGDLHFGSEPQARSEQNAFLVFEAQSRQHSPISFLMSDRN